MSFVYLINKDRESNCMIMLTYCRALLECCAQRESAGHMKDVRQHRIANNDDNHIEIVRIGTITSNNFHSLHAWENIIIIVGIVAFDGICMRFAKRNSIHMRDALWDERISVFLVWTSKCSVCSCVVATSTISIFLNVSMCSAIACWDYVEDALDFIHFVAIFTRWPNSPISLSTNKLNCVGWVPHTFGTATRNCTSHNAMYSFECE